MQKYDLSQNLSPHPQLRCPKNPLSGGAEMVTLEHAVNYLPYHTLLYRTL